MSELRNAGALATDAARPFRFDVVVSRTNATITEALLEGALGALGVHGAQDETVRVCHVPGAFELPMTAAKLAKSNPDAIICIGALIRGETPHFDYLSAAVAQGIQDVAIDSGIPTVFAVLTCDSMEQATARAGGDKGNKGAEAAIAAIEMATLFAALP